MPAAPEHSFDELHNTDLVVDAVYKGGPSANSGSDPLARIVPVGNQGGFRTAGGRSLPDCKLVVVFSNLAEPNWPDELDAETGRFTYYGDNRRPGHQLHDTPRGGNALLRAVFDAVHSTKPRRDEVPPFLVFSGTGEGRDVRFRGLAVPGFPVVSATDDLVAIWKTTGTQRFQNYRAYFTVLDVPVVSRAWLDELIAGNRTGPNAPAAFADWVRFGRYRPLEAPRTVRWRSKQQQLPTPGRDAEALRTIHHYFRPRPTEFERCAAALAKMMAPNIVSIDVTRPWMDGGRDAVGQYRIGTDADAISVEFALEAKCYDPNSGVGVKATSRLISRLRFRQFGIFVTTSFLNHQAYEEIRLDGHPVVVLCGRDIARLLADKGLTTSALLEEWLKQEFPLTR